MINELTKIQFNILHIVVGFLVMLYLRDSQYITATIIYVMGAIFCSLMDILNKRNKGT